VIYDKELTLRFDGEEIRLIHPPLAHTDGDTITVFRRANVIHTGDIFVMGAFPYMKESSIDGYIFAQEILLRLSNDQTLFIPGHGTVARRSDVEKSLQVMREVRRRMTVLIGQGLSKDQILARHPLDDLNPGGSRDIQSGQAVAGYVYDSMTAMAAKEAARH